MYGVSTWIDERDRAASSIPGSDGFSVVLNHQWKCSFLPMGSPVVLNQSVYVCAMQPVVDDERRCLSQSHELTTHLTDYPSPPRAHGVCRWTDQVKTLLDEH